MGRAGTARSPIGPGRATTVLRAGGAAHGPARAARSARSGRAGPQPDKHLMF